MRKSRYSTMGLLAGVVVGLLLGCQVAKGDFVFGEPVLVPNVNSSSADLGPSISADGLELYFVSNRDHGADLGYCGIWVAKRATTDDEWGEPVNLGAPINTADPVADPSISADGLELYFSEGHPVTNAGGAWRSGGYGNGDLWVSKRATRDGDWGIPVNLGTQINSRDYDGTPAISADGLSLFFSSQRPGGHGTTDLYMATRPTRDDPWGPPANLGAPVNTSMWEQCPHISPDGLWLFFTVDPGGVEADIFVSKRATITDPWGLPEPLGAVNTPKTEYFTTFAPGSSTLYFARAGRFASWSSPTQATWDLWQVSIEPSVDFNDDGEVNAKDMSILVDYWHTSDPLCDIGPTALGDGVIDIQDLIVLSEYLEPGFGRIAHWELDEAGGTVAYDSVGSNHADIMGDAVWQPNFGKVAGALAFDGVDDYMAPALILNPNSRPFRIFAWIKGGAPGQTIASQTPTEFQLGGVYLAADPADGTLMTEAVLPMQLKSEVVITDDQWHEVGLEWDGERRHLYVDGEAVAADEVALPSFDRTGWLNIGTGKDSEPGSFWSGLIDEVRIYERVVRP